jgi:hypothetical protein
MAGRAAKLSQLNPWYARGDDESQITSLLDSCVSLRVRRERCCRVRADHDRHRGRTEVVTVKGETLASLAPGVATRSLPKNAGVGVANSDQSPRSIQAQVKFSF